ncbi:hypothetical protein ACT7DC_22460 [Bacillus cereus]
MRGAFNTPGLSLSANTITINSIGLYQVNYMYSPVDLNPINAFAPVQVRLNGIPISGSNLYSNPHPTIGWIGPQPASGSIIINVSTALSTLDLINSMASTGSIELGAFGNCTQVSITKIG